MPTGDDADNLKKLEDTYGTGDITPIATQVLQLAGIKFTAQHYDSRTDDSLFVAAETEPVHGRPASTFLNDAATIASTFPPPRSA
jgi:hypothetical protein